MRRLLLRKWLHRVVVPKSHEPATVAKIEAYREAHPTDVSGLTDQEAEHARMQDTKVFTACGLEPVLLRVPAGDLVLFDTVCTNHLQTTSLVGPRLHTDGAVDNQAMYHGATAAAEPGGNSLLRAIFIQSMAPAARMGQGFGEDEEPFGSDHRSDVIRARQIACEKNPEIVAVPTASGSLANVQAPRSDETDVVTGGSCMTPRSARALLESEAEQPKPRVRRLADASPTVRRLVTGGHDARL